MEERHRHRDGGEEHAPRAGEAVGRPFLGFDELLGLLQALFGNDRFCGRLRPFVGHGPSSRGPRIIRHGTSNKKPRLGRGFVGRARGYLSWTPFSAKYLIAPGWYGSGEAVLDCVFTLKLAASLWTWISSSCLSKIVFTTL